MAELPKIKVRSGLKDSRVALWERHPQHPEGEVFIANRVDQKGELQHPEFEVARTPEVEKRLRTDVLIEAGGVIEKVTDFFSGEDDKPKEEEKPRVTGRRNG